MALNGSSCNKKYMMFLLNYIGKGFHTGLEFNFRDFIIDHNLQDDEFQKLIKDYNKHNFPKEQNLIINEIMFDVNFLKEISELTIPYHTVILQHPDNHWKMNYKGMKLQDYWKTKPVKEWYNLPPIWWNENKFKDQLLPHLNTKPYIKVIDLFMKIQLSSIDKGSALTIYDIFFATIGLSRDCNRFIIEYDKGYKIVYESDGELILQPNVDNGLNNIK